MTSTITFASLTPADALDLAVLIEEEARQRYLELIDLVADAGGDAEALRFFQTMAAHEEEHARQLMERRERLFADQPPRVTAAMLERLGGIETAGPAGVFSLRAGLEAAMAAERQAEGFFRRALREATDPEVRRLFEELAEEEVEHQRAVAAHLAVVNESPRRSAGRRADRTV